MKNLALPHTKQKTKEEKKKYKATYNSVQLIVIIASKNPEKSLLIFWFFTNLFVFTFFTTCVQTLMKISKTKISVKWQSRYCYFK